MDTEANERSSLLNSSESNNAEYSCCQRYTNQLIVAATDSFKSILLTIEVSFLLELVVKKNFAV